MPNRLLGAATPWRLSWGDAFDRSAGRQSSGTDLAAGALELWRRTLAETVRPGGQRGFVDFRLYWTEPDGFEDCASIQLFGPWMGDPIARVKDWVAERGDDAVLRALAGATVRLLRARPRPMGHAHLESERILACVDERVTREQLVWLLDALAPEGSEA